MTELRYTLLTDGPSDDALLPILSWLLAGHMPVTAFQPQWADLRRLQGRPRSLSDRVRTALDLFPCDVLFVHRDAERASMEHRVAEIREAVEAAGRPVPHLCVVPVRMTEAWLLFDVAAIRRAAGNPNGEMPLELPELSRVEGLPNPKNILNALLRRASGLRGRRLKSLRVPVRRVADLIDDFAPLRQLRAFQRLEQDVHAFARDRR